MNKCKSNKYQKDSQSLIHMLVWSPQVKRLTLQGVRYPLWLHSTLNTTY
ncbi:hypothetical protein JXO59_06160 [candidate division KSB1 bacterium]|nr:hypothetical protein [candidate division KSB1 bacterium]